MTYPENGRTGGGAEALDDNVEDSLEDGDVTGHDHGDGHSGVDVAAADMAHNLQTCKKSGACLEFFH
jgi:hypothetical protein